MSYEIVYGRQFIKAEKDGKEVFFPMLYMGSNNCTQMSPKGREIRERGWHNATYNLRGKRFGTLQEMLDFIDEERKRTIEGNEAHRKRCQEEGDMSWFTEYSDKHWGYFTSISFGGGCKSTFGQYRGLFITGCKKALTVEELKELGVRVFLQTGSFYYNEKLFEKFKAAGKKEIEHTVNTSKELMEKLEEFAEYLKDFPTVPLYLSMDADETDLRRIRRIKFPTKKTNPTYKEVDQYFVVNIVGYGYYYNSKRYGFRYTPYQTSGKAFASQKLAEKFCKRFAKRHSYLQTLKRLIKKQQ